MQLLIFAVVTAVVAIAVEYLTRGVPAPWRWVILALAAIGLLIWLFNILGVLTI